MNSSKDVFSENSFRNCIANINKIKERDTNLTIDGDVKTAIECYTDENEFYIRINDLCRNCLCTANNPNTQKYTSCNPCNNYPKVTNIRDNLINYINTTTIPKGVTESGYIVYRGVTSVGRSTNRIELLNGSLNGNSLIDFMENMFISTSGSIQAVKEFIDEDKTCCLLVIHLPKTAKMRYIGNMSLCGPYEDEYLLPPGMKFKVVHCRKVNINDLNNESVSLLQIPENDNGETMCNNPNNNPNNGLHVYYLTTVATNGGKSTKKHSSKVPLSVGKMTFMTGGKRITRTVYKKSTGGSYYKMKNPETHKMEYKRIRSKMHPVA